MALGSALTGFVEGFQGAQGQKLKQQKLRLQQEEAERRKRKDVIAEREATTKASAAEFQAAQQRVGEAVKVLQSLKDNPDQFNKFGTAFKSSTQGIADLKLLSLDTIDIKALADGQIETSIDEVVTAKSQERLNKTARLFGVTEDLEIGDRFQGKTAAGKKEHTITPFDKRGALKLDLENEKLEQEINAKQAELNAQTLAPFTEDEQKKLQTRFDFVETQKVFQSSAQQFIAATNAVKLLEMKSPVADRAIGIILAKILDPGGRVTDDDRRAMGGSPEIDRRIADAKRQILEDGLMSDTTREEMVRFAKALETQARLEIEPKLRGAQTNLMTSAGISPERTEAHLQGRLNKYVTEVPFNPETNEKIDELSESDKRLLDIAKSGGPNAQRARESLKTRGILQ
jgi:hypothetical protein